MDSIDQSPKLLIVESIGEALSIHWIKRAAYLWVRSNKSISVFESPPQISQAYSPVGRIIRFQIMAFVTGVIHLGLTPMLHRECRFFFNFFDALFVLSVVLTDRVINFPAHTCSFLFSMNVSASRTEISESFCLCPSNKIKQFSFHYTSDASDRHSFEHNQVVVEVHVQKYWVKVYRLQEG